MYLTNTNKILYYLFLTNPKTFQLHIPSANTDFLAIKIGKPTAIKTNAAQILSQTETCRKMEIKRQER